LRSNYLEVVMNTKEEVDDMSNLASEVAELKAQMQLLINSGEAPVEVKSVWIVHNPRKRGRLCHKAECECCPPMGRKITYDVVKEGTQENEDGELENIIMQGVSEEESNADDVVQKVKRVGSPTKSYDQLGVVSAFTSKKKALDFMEEYFRLNQDNDPDELQLTEVKVVS